MKKAFAQRFIGDRSFYRRAMSVIAPIMLQNVVTNFVSLLDNIMVGQTGTASMSGVAVAGQLYFIFYLVIFGTVSGPGIFCAQFWGAQDESSFKAAFRYKLYTAIAMCGLCAAVFALWSRQLVGLYLTGEQAQTAEVMDYALDYLKIMLWGMAPYTISMVYASTLRETGRTFVPMLASWAAVAINLALNWVLIFGKLGAPAMGAQGAAIATVVSRYAEMGINVLWAHTHGGEVIFARRILKAAPMSGRLLRLLFVKSMPMMLNEALWCIGTATLTQLYSTRGLEVVAALNINFVLSDLFTAVVFSVGTSIGIIVGQELGAGQTEKAVDADRKLLALGVTVSAAIGIVMLSFAELFPRFYNTSDEIRSLAAQLIRVTAVALPFDCFANGCYFTMRSGGKTAVTFLFDSGYSWCVNVPVVYLLAHLTDMAILPLYAISMGLVSIKCLSGGLMVHRRYWVNTLSVTEMT